MKDIPKIIRLPYNVQELIPELENITYSVFWVDISITVSEFVKYAEWGGNRLIREGGVRIGHGEPIKEMTVIKDPNYSIQESCQITKGKGKEFSYIWIITRR